LFIFLQVKAATSIGKNAIFAPADIASEKHIPAVLDAAEFNFGRAIQYSRELCRDRNRCLKLEQERNSFSEIIFQSIACEYCRYSFNTLRLASTRMALNELNAGGERAWLLYISLRFKKEKKKKNYQLAPVEAATIEDVSLEEVKNATTSRVIITRVPKTATERDNRLDFFNQGLCSESDILTIANKWGMCLIMESTRALPGRGAGRSAKQL
jgi:hypothetical protein